MDLSNEVLNIDFSQGAAKISEVDPVRVCIGVQSGRVSNIFSVSNFDIFVPLEQNECLVPQCAEEKSNESTKDMDGTFTGW